ncbi:MAG: hypothetical protein RL664_2064 [Bacteroidota bacterium]
MKKHVVLFLSLIAFSASAQVDHWETVVYDTLEWHYIVPDATTPSEWISPSFDDSAWSVGNGGFGFGDGDDGTNIPTGNISVYHRIHFIINDWNEISKFILNMDYDDSYVAYLNGVEISRSNISSAGQPAWNDGADGQHEANMYQGGLPDEVIFLTILVTLPRGHFLTSDLQQAIVTTERRLHGLCNLLNSVLQPFRLLS